MPLWSGARALASGHVDEVHTYVTEAQRLGERAGSVNAQALVPTQRWFLAGELADRDAIRAVFGEFEIVDSMGPWVPISRALVHAQLDEISDARANR